MASLYWLSVSYILLVFEIINHKFPDEALYFNNEVSTFTLSSVIIMTPVFLFLTRYLNKYIANNPSKRDIWVRKWSIYLTLFIASVTVIADLIAILNFYLSGELTIRFILKAIVLIIIPLVIFWYLLKNLTRDYTKNTFYKIPSVVVGILILSTIVFAFVIAGSPSEKRSERLDNMRVNDLRSIQSEVLNHYLTKNELPNSLQSLNDPFRGFRSPSDPLTGESYIYEIENENTFSLCATFQSKQDYDERGGYYDVEYSQISENWTWNHEEGLNCFKRTIDKDKFINPNTPKIIY